MLSARFTQVWWCIVFEKNFVSTDVKRLEEALDRVKLEELRAQGQDVKKHIIDTRTFWQDVSWRHNYM